MLTGRTSLPMPSAGIIPIFKEVRRAEAAIFFGLSQSDQVEIYSKRDERSRGTMI